MLIAIEQLLNTQEVKDLRAQLASADWFDGRYSAGAQAAAVKANLQLNDTGTTAEILRQRIGTALGRHPLFISAALPYKLYPPKFNCYRDGGHYGTHVDAALMTLPSGDSLRTDLSATLFLSEPDEYDGGELVIETLYGAQPVKLAAGDLILYPSTSLHQVTPVTRGTRLAAFFWVQSRVRDNQQRSMLFDLDQSIQTLTGERGSGDAEVMRLTGIYHNLVRLWSEA